MAGVVRWCGCGLRPYYFNHYFNVCLMVVVSMAAEVVPCNE